jgi:hypothetical protein
VRIVDGYSITVKRKHMCREAGWWFEVKAPAPDRGVIAEGWTVGYGPRAKSQAMKDALEAIRARQALLAIATKKGWS